MSQIPIDIHLSRTLSTVVGPVDLCDPAGRVVGRFIPRLDPNEFQLEPEISNEEMDRRLRNMGKGHTTAEVLEFLEKL